MHNYAATCVNGNHALAFMKLTLQISLVLTVYKNEPEPEKPVCVISKKYVAFTSDIGL